VGFGAAALLSRDREKGVKPLHNAVGADTRRFVQSQGPEFLSLVVQVVDAVQKQHGNKENYKPKLCVVTQLICPPSLLPC
jgi:hypothetical protein